MISVTISGAKDDGWEQPEGHTAAADRGQNDPLRRQGRRRTDQLRGVLRHCWQHRRTQEDGGRCIIYNSPRKLQHQHYAFFMSMGFEMLT